MRLPGIPRPHIDLFSGQRAARRWLYAAFAVVLVAFVVLLSANIGVPRHAPSIDTAAAWIALLAVCATVVAIVAAYVELRTLFPRQELSVDADNIWVIREDGGGAWVTFRNDASSALINAFRLEVRLENADGDPLFDREPDEWTRGGAWVQQGDAEYFATHWIRQENASFFPGSAIEGPRVNLEREEGLFWRVTWWTDRAGPVEVLLPMPPPRGAPAEGV